MVGRRSKRACLPYVKKAMALLTSSLTLRVSVKCAILIRAGANDAGEFRHIPNPGLCELSKLDFIPPRCEWTRRSFDARDANLEGTDDVTR